MVDLLDCPDDVPPEIRRALNQLIADQTLGSAVFRFQTESTNTDALAEVNAGLDPQTLPRLHWADRQTAGRGRQGNTWISNRKSLTFSLVLRGDGLLDSPLSMFIGVAVARAIEFHCAPSRVGLKWPNDLYAGDAKLGGILIETNQSQLNQVVVGIGINVSEAPTIDDVGAIPATSLTELSPRAIDRSEVLVALVESVVQTLDELDATELIDSYRQRCILKGTTVSLVQNIRSFTGHCLGVNERGELQLMVDGQTKTFHSGEARRTRINR